MRKIVNDESLDFPFKDKNGVCEMLKDNKCSIYETRPIVCNTEEMFKLLHNAIGIDVPEFLKYQAVSCRKNQMGLRKFDKLRR